MDFPPFPGFRDEAFAFFAALAENNDRAWFKPRKETYDDEVVWPLQCLVVDVTRQASAQGLPLKGDPKRSLYRIYRDTRFSKTKLPYKTHAAAVLSRTGDRKEPGGVYIHVEPGKSMLAAGYWRPERNLLRAWRTQMTQDPASFLATVAALEAAGLTLRDGEALKRMPRGFEAFADAEIAPFLRMKSFVVVRNFDDALLQTPALTDYVIAFTRDILPLLHYGWDLLDAQTLPTA